MSKRSGMYKFEKRKKELLRKKKKEEKRLKRQKGAEVPPQDSETGAPQSNEGESSEGVSEVKDQ